MESHNLNNQGLVKSCISNLILVCIDLEKWEEATQWYQEYQKNNGRDYPTIAFYGYIARLHAKNRNFEEAFMLLDETWKKTKNLQDSITLYHAESQVHQMNGSWEEAYRSIEKSVSLQNKIVRESLQQPVLTTQNNFLNQELQYKEYKLKTESYIRLLGFTILLLVSILAILLLRKKLLRNYQKSLKEKLEERDCAHEKKIKTLQQEALKREDSLRSHAAQLEARATLSKEDIERLKKELEESKMHIEEARKFREQHQQETDLLKSDNHDALLRINKMLKNHFKQIENTYQVLQVKYKTADNRDKAIEEYIQNTTAEFYGSKKADRNLEKLVNELYGDAMRQLRKEIKLPSEEHYRLSCLLLAGLSINFIATLTGETTNAIYKRRDKIREIIKDSNCVCEELCLFI